MNKIIKLHLLEVSNTLYKSVIVKRGKIIEAKIYYPNASRVEFQVEQYGCAFYYPSLESSIEFVRKGIEGRMNAFGGNVKVEMK